MDSFEEPDRYCIITEYCPYKTLDVIMQELRRKDKYLSEFGVLKYFCEILEGLQHLQSKRIMHRDIKPENIFITPENACILGDFGLAGVYSKSEELIVKGNPLYSAPEVYFDGRYHQKSEIWSIGLILYELSTNIHLQKFLDNKVCNLEKMMIKKDYLPKSYPTHLKEIKKVVERCLVIDPEQRASIEELKNLPIIKEHMNGITIIIILIIIYIEAANTLFVKDTMDNKDIDENLKRFSDYKPDRLFTYHKDIISLFKLASKIQLSRIIYNNNK